MYIDAIEGCYSNLQNTNMIRKVNKLIDLGNIGALKEVLDSFDGEDLDQASVTIETGKQKTKS